VSHLFIAATACLVACPLFLAQPVVGAESLMPVESIDSEYLVDTWQTERGLPDNFVNAIAQTPEGYLWVATFNGLARFNGVEFVASKALLLVRKDGAIMRMILEDDGVGFDYDSVMKRAATGFGLANLSERIHLLGGSLKIDTGPGKRTRLSIELPCKT
jgi:ligand-binding sensor domain-containing protein